MQHASDAPSPTGLVAAAAAVRAVAVGASGLILAAGLALVLWAVTPSSGADVGIALQGGVVAFAAANLMPVLIGGITLTLPPLLLTLAIAALLAATARRGRFLPQGRYQETVSILVTTVVYGIVVAAACRGLGPPEAVPARWVWTAPALAFVATALGMLRPGSAWHGWWIETAPGWARVGVRGGGIGVGVLIAGGGIALSVGLVAHFGSAVGVAALAAPSWLDGLGLAMLGMAYVPNAVIAAAGYVAGVGFEMGAGTYSPFGTTIVDLPAVPLLAAAPDQAGRSWIGLAFLVVPAIAGYLIARPAIKHLSTRSDRVVASAVAAALTGGLLAAVAAIARGGVGDGRWSAFGVPPALLGAIVAVEVGAIALLVAGLTGGRSVPWRLSSPQTAELDDESTGGDQDDQLAAADVSVDAQPDVDVASDEDIPEAEIEDDSEIEVDSEVVAEVEDDAEMDDDSEVEVEVVAELEDDAEMDDDSGIDDVAETDESARQTET